MIKQKLKYKFNFVDALLIILIIGIVGALYYFTFGKTINGADSLGVNEINDVTYVLELKKVDREFLDEIRVGDELWDTFANVKIGTISKIKSPEPAYLEIKDSLTGEIHKAVYPPVSENSEETDETQTEEKIERTASDSEIYDFYNVKIVVDADMVYTGSSYSIDGVSIYVGKDVAFRTVSFEGRGVCISFDAAEQGESK